MIVFTNNRGVRVVVNRNDNKKSVRLSTHQYRLTPKLNLKGLPEYRSYIFPESFVRIVC